MVEDQLQRFLTAQDDGGTYRTAIRELTAGRKESHWMWFVFPQLAGLGRSATAHRFSIASLAEASEYLGHPVLGPRLVKAAELLLTHPGLGAEEIFGPVDAQKLRSSMTLFHRADPNEQVFRRVLERYFGDVPDGLTDYLVAKPADSDPDRFQ